MDGKNRKMDVADEDHGGVMTSMNRVEDGNPLKPMRGKPAPTLTADTDCFEWLLAERRKTTFGCFKPPDIMMTLRADAWLSTYKRDYMLPSRITTQPPTIDNRPAPQHPYGVPRTRACNRFRVWPQTNVTYRGSPPPLNSLSRPEYWWTHDKLARRLMRT